MKLLRDDIAEIIHTATLNYENGADPSCGDVADAIMELIQLHIGGCYMSGMLFDIDTLNAQPKTMVKHDDPKAKDLPHLYGKQVWHPAKPIGWCGMSLRWRIRAAWYVLTNRAVAVRWY